MESNVLYAVASPGILRLWPWVNQVCFLPQRVSNGQNHFSQPRIRRLSQSLPHCPLRSLCSSLNAWGMCTTFFLLLRSWDIISHPPPSPCPQSPRVILVEDFGTLVGLTTVKDVLHLEPHGQLNSPMIAWSNRGALDGALEELWTWLADVRSSANAWYSRVSRRLRRR